MYQSFQDIIDIEKETGKSFWEIVRDNDCREMEITEEEAFRRMQAMYLAMGEADASYDPALSSASGLVGGDGEKLADARRKDSLLCGSFLGLVMEKAVKMGESNACMRRIVAAPTAGSCGILPAAVLTIRDARGLDERTCVMSLFTASAVGMVIANNACLAGAQGGCQAECGSASAMAAAALVELAGGAPDMVANAVAIAIKNILGLVCDPVAGLVEIPCIKRNASGVANALCAAELALAGITSAIPADEVILTMKRVGDTMPAALRETAEGGLAMTPTGRRLFKQVFGT